MFLLVWIGMLLTEIFLDKHHIMSLNELQLQGRFAVSVLRKLMIL
ncbi:Uncharacterised protein [Mycobacterium tuberculosis]|nr:Uncharacterised protein [Mycobacterium tuberculosis]